MESPIIFNIYPDFVLRCAEKAVLERYPNIGLKYPLEFLITVQAEMSVKFMVLQVFKD